MKQETLEEAVEKYAEQYIYIGGKISFIRGAKWQQERICEHNYILTTEQGHRIIKCLKCNNIQPI